MHQIIIVLVSLFLGGCFGAQVRQAPPQAPSPSATPAHLKGEVALLLQASAEEWPTLNAIIKDDGGASLDNSKVAVVKGFSWDGKAWSLPVKVAFFHWTPSSILSAAQERAVAEADVVVACYATTLPPHAKAKAWILSKGKTTAWAVWTNAQNTQTQIQGMDAGVKVFSKEEDDRLAEAAAKGLGK